MAMYFTIRPSAVKHGKHNQATHGRKGRAGRAGAAAYKQARAGGASLSEARAAGKVATAEERTKEKAEAAEKRRAGLVSRAADKRILADSGKVTPAKAERLRLEADRLEARARGERVGAMPKKTPTTPELSSEVTDPSRPSPKVAAEAKAAREALLTNENLAKLDRIKELDDEINRLSGTSRLLNPNAPEILDLVKQQNALIKQKREIEESISPLSLSIPEGQRLRIPLDVPLLGDGKGQQWMEQNIAQRKDQSRYPPVYTNISTRHQRASYEVISTTLRVHPSSPQSTIVHELGHWVDLNATRQRSQAFLQRRTKGEKAVPLSKLTGKNYSKSEIAKPDKFIDPYIGKTYVFGSEVVSMGLQYMYSNPVRFARDDPDMFDFIYSVMKGE
jgi:hypothetical protein